MRSRALRGIVAASLAVLIGVSGTAQPVAAKRPDATIQVFDWVSAVVAVAGVVFGGGGSSGNVDAAVRQVIAAVEASEAEILNHIDAIASAEVRACTRSHTIEFSDIQFFTPSVLQRWAQDVTRCAALATAYLDAVQSPQAVDNLGSLVGEIYAIAVAARAKAGFVNGIDLLLRDQIHSYETVIVKLTPTDCRRITRRPPQEPATRLWACTAYNGVHGQSTEVFLPSEPIRTEAEDDATRTTSRPVAQNALPRLRAVLGG